MATRQKANPTAAVESNGLPTITESATDLVRPSTGVGKPESAYTKSVREMATTAAKTRKTYQTSFEYGKDGALAKDAAKFVATLQRVSSELNVSFRFGSDHPDGLKLAGTTLCFVAVDRITRKRKAKGEGTTTAKA